MAPNVWNDMYQIYGYWGDTTSTLDWCEENYIVLSFIAEFWNTISNVFLIFMPLFLMYSAAKQRMDLTIIVGIFSVFVVGIGSACFHGSLTYEMQMLDELPMLVAASFLVYHMMTITFVWPSIWSFFFAITISIFCITSIYMYLILNDPMFHEAAYGFLIIASIIASTYAVYKHKLYNCSKLLFCGYFITLIAFVLWNIDNTYCPNLRIIRDASGILRPLFELHAWWHVLCGIGTHFIILSHIRLRYSYLKVPHRIYFCCCCFPYVKIHR